MYLLTQFNRVLRLALCVGFLAVISSCSKQPPECTSSNLGDTIKNIVKNQVVEMLKHGELKLSDTTRGQIDKYLSDIKLSFGTTVEEGHNKETRLRVCKGTYSITSPTGKKWDISTRWQAQVTADKKDYAVNVPTQDVELRLLGDLKDYLVSEKKLTGSWDAQLKCPKKPDMDAATQEKPFKLTVKDDTISGKQARNNGGYNSYIGTLNVLSEEVSLHVSVYLPDGTKENTYGAFVGSMQGEKPQVKVGECTLDMKRS